MRRFFEINAEQVEATWASTAKPAPFSLGDIAYCNEHGRVGLFRFSRNMHGSALAAGELVCMPNISGTDWEQAAVVYTAATASTAASLKGNTDAVTTTFTENELAGFIVAITLGTGLGQFAQVTGNKAATAATDKLTSYLSRNFGTALAATDNYQILPLDYCIKTAAATDAVTGVAPVAVTNGYYFWRQISGLCWVLIHDSAAITTAPLSFGPCTTAGTGLVRDADGDDFDTQPDFTGVAIAKKSASADTPAICQVRCLISMPF